MKNNIPDEILICSECLQTDCVAGEDMCENARTADIIKYIRADKVKEMMDAKNELLACYRLGRHPSEKLLDKLDKIQKEFEDGE